MATSRDDVVSQVTSAPADIVIIGGGITGAACLRDAAMRGLYAVLLEKSDFGAGASSRSSKLIHGGLRYLETYEFRLVFEALRERARLLSAAPLLVRPMPFLYPVYRGQSPSLPLVILGVCLYEALSIPRNLRRPRFALRRRTIGLEPELREKGLIGSALYFDAVTGDADLTLSVLRGGRRAGGIALNHAEVIGLIETAGSVIGVRVADRFGGRTFDIRARWTLNASGPWSDDVRSLAAGGEQPRLRLTKGVHALLPPGRIRHERAVFMRSPQDGRVAFVIPWAGHTLLGTTDTDFCGNPDNVTADIGDVDYLLDAANFYFPRAGLGRGDVVSTFAGLRPLLDQPDRDPSQVSREHEIRFEAPGFVTLSGGKLTTHRQMAEDLLAALIRRTPEWRAAACGTADAPLPVLDGGGGEVVAGIGVTWDEVDEMIRSEMAATVSDVLDVRSGIAALAPHACSEVAVLVAQRLARHFGLSARQTDAQLLELKERLRRRRAGLEPVSSSSFSR